MSLTLIRKEIYTNVATQRNKVDTGILFEIRLSGSLCAGAVSGNGKTALLYQKSINSKLHHAGALQKMPGNDSMEKKAFIKTLEKRFGENMQHHSDLNWSDVQAALEKSDRVEILMRMEKMDGEPDVVGYKDGRFWFYDCSPESPTKRRSVCYDEAAWNAREENKPVSSAEKMAGEIGADILNEEDYLYLQGLGEFDVKSQSWILTDTGFRKKGDALFGSKCHGRTFIYCNGVQSYYRIRGFRCKIMI